MSIAKVRFFLNIYSDNCITIPVQLILMARGINSPLTIQPDNLEVSYMLETGCQVWYAENVQELFDMSIAAFVVAEKPDVHVPIVTVVDGFFVSHTRESVMLPADDIALFPYEPYKSPLPPIDSETPPGRFLRDPFVMKSNYISYATHASWQFEVRSAVERSRPYAEHFLNGLVHVTGEEDAEIAFVTCGTASHQAKEAHRDLMKQGVKTKVIKLRTIRPFPDAGRARWQVSTSSGVWPLWAPDSGTLYFRTRAGQVIAAEVLEGATFAAGEQRELFTLAEILGGDVTWDLAPDGEHFVVIRSRGLGADGELVLVDNITTELTERVR